MRSLAVTLLLSSAALAQTLPLRGDMHIHSAVAEGEKRVKILPLLESARFRVRDTWVDFLGVCDPASNMNDDMFLAYLGVLRQWTSTPTVIPGFEWKADVEWSIFGARYPARTTLNLLHPPLRVGRLIPDAAATAYSALHTQLRPSGLLAIPADLYFQALDWGYGQKPVTNDLLSLETATFNTTSPIESIWGPSSAGSVVSTFDSVAAQQQSEGLKRMGNLAEEIATSQPQSIGFWLDRLQDTMLRTGNPPGPVTERLSLVPGFRTAETTLDAGATNLNFAKAYGQYFTYLAAGLNVTAGSLQTLEAARTQFAADLAQQEPPHGQVANWDQFALWLENQDPQGRILVQWNRPMTGGLVKALQVLDPRKLRGRPRLRQRLGLMELASGEGGAAVNSTGGTTPGNVSGATGGVTVSMGLPFYDLALRNGWRVAPTSGLDNSGLLSASTNATLPAVRDRFTGLYPGDPGSLANGNYNWSGSGGDRAPALLEALDQRRTFVSEHPFVDALFFARSVDSGRITMMGGNLYSGGGGPETVEFSVVLRAQSDPNATTPIKVYVPTQILLCAVAEQEHFMGPATRLETIVNHTRAGTAPASLTPLLTDRIAMLPNFTTGTQGTIPRVLQNYGIGGGEPIPLPSPTTMALPLTFTYRTTVRPHSPGGVIAYYALIGLPQPNQEPGNLPANYLVTAPLWTVPNWTNFVSSDEGK